MKQEIPITWAFITKSEGLANRLINQAVVIYNEQEFVGAAQWDTGATGTCISEKVVQELSLVPIGRNTIQTPSGQKDVSTYMVDIVLRNNVRINNVVVMSTEIGQQGIDILVGMDLIMHGDFAVSNYEGKTSFTFRTPSRKETNYVAEVNKEKLLIKAGTHGKGKRKK